MKQILILIFLLSLLSATIAFAVTQAEKEFTTGNYTKFSTAGHPKSKGVNIALSYPNSWFAKEGERPNIVQKFIGQEGSGVEGALILIKDLPLAPGTVIEDSELREFFTPDEMKTMVPSEAKFIHAKPTKIEGIPAGILEYSIRQERAGFSFDSQYILYIFIYNTTMVQLQCMVSTGQATTSDILNSKMDEFRPLFSLMANSIVLQDKWK